MAFLPEGSAGSVAMPLAFESLSHGTVAFGFFHIETDMLLLQDLFFFGNDFCRTVEKLAQSPETLPFREDLPGFRFQNPAAIGDLMGAIHGIRFTGFIGELYRRCPFSENPEWFRQKTRGRFSRDWVTEEIRKWAAEDAVPFQKKPPDGPVSIGPYRFDMRGFQSLVAYVIRGGYPRWESDQPPGYVLSMMDLLKQGGGHEDCRGD